MELNDVVLGLTALAQKSRLAVFRLLVKRGPEGYTPGQLNEKLGVPAPTLSFHLKELQRAGLIEARREGWHLFYSLYSTLFAHEPSVRQADYANWTSEEPRTDASAKGECPCGMPSAKREAQGASC